MAFGKNPQCLYKDFYLRGYFIEKLEILVKIGAGLMIMGIIIIFKFMLELKIYGSFSTKFSYKKRLCSPNSGAAFGHLVKNSAATSQTLDQCKCLLKKKLYFYNLHKTTVLAFPK